eukprot:m.152906 g.152906  ORF g.152906 m.152906 type:complete len:53 (+) comp14334_c0_seq1:8291-8449(+)
MKRRSALESCNCIFAVVFDVSLIFLRLVSTTTDNEVQQVCVRLMLAVDRVGL